MLHKDRQLGKPFVVYTDTQANIESTVGLSDGSFAYANDIGQMGYLSNGEWFWINPSGGVGSGVGVTDHGALTGLADDDHTQYYNSARHTKAVHDALDIDADTLDGLDSAYFAPSGHVHASGGSLTVQELDGSPTIADVTLLNISGGTVTNNGGGSVTVAFSGGSGTDTNAIHVNVSGEILGIAEKTTPAVGDVFVMEDSASTYVKKRISFNNLSSTASSVSLYVNGTTGNDSNSGTISFPVATINEALNRFKGKLLNSCNILIARGTYPETLAITDFAGTLNLTGSTAPATLVGLAYMHGGKRWNTFTGEGNGTVTLAADNSGTGGRIKFTATCSTANPDFVAGGITTNNNLSWWNGTGWDRAVGITAVTATTITVDSTNGAPTMNVNGRFFAISHGIYMSPGTFIVCRVSGGVSAQVSGFEFYSSASSCVRVEGMSNLLMFRTLVGASGTVGILAIENSSIASQSAPLTVCNESGAVGVDVNMARFSAAYISVKGDTYGIRSANNGTAIVTNANISDGTTGLYAYQGGYINALTTNATNFATTAASPATTDTLGNNSGIISRS